MRASKLFSFVCLAGLSFAGVACSSSDSAAPAGTGGTGGTGGSGGSGGTGGTGGSSEGGTDGGLSGACFGTDPVCGIGNSACYAMIDNVGQATQTFRIHQVVAQSPPALKGLQTLILTPNVPLKLEACNTFGKGRITWLFSWDSATKKLTMGGGPPMPDGTKAKDGTCMLDIDDTANGQHLQPVTVDATVGADGTVTASAFPQIALPIYLDDTGSSVVYLPARNLHLADMKITDGGNCIGHFRGDTLPADTCVPPAGEYAWTTGGTLKGTITVADSDKVWVSDLKESLCVVLSGDPTTYSDGVLGNQHCKKDGAGNILLKGDWDLATDSARAPGTGDSFQLVADFAAGAFKVNGTKSTLTCQ